MLVSLVSLVWSIFNTVLRGYLIKTFWVWFILTQFPSLPHISTIAAIGFSFFVSALAPLRSPSAREIDDFKNRNSEDGRMTNLFIQIGFTIGTLITLFSGWVVHHFM